MKKIILSLVLAVGLLTAACEPMKNVGPSPMHRAGDGSPVSILDSQKLGPNGSPVSILDAPPRMTTNNIVWGE